jgi:hypothetical protein
MKQKSLFAAFAFLLAISLLPFVVQAFPIVLAANSNNQVKITWTATCNNVTSHFDIERSTDGSNWTRVYRLFSYTPVTCQLDFDYTDYSPAGGKQFYRILQTSLDGGIQPSEVQSITLKGLPRYQLRSNPVGSTLQLDISQEAAIQKQYQILSSDGRVLQAGVLQMNIPVLAIASGLYRLRIIDRNNRQPVLITFFKY